mgnify:CR=1 FL=1
MKRINDPKCFSATALFISYSIILSFTKTAIIEEFMLDIMYQIPRDDNIGRVTITGDYIEGTGGPLLEMRGVLALEQE